jgi:hypothetical protein
MKRILGFAAFGLLFLNMAYSQDSAPLLPPPTLGSPDNIKISNPIITFHWSDNNRCKLLRI